MPICSLSKLVHAQTQLSREEKQSCHFCEIQVNFLGLVCGYSVTWKSPNLFAPHPLKHCLDTQL